MKLHDLDLFEELFGVISVSPNPTPVISGACIDRDQVMRKLRVHKAELRRFGVSRLYLFGSIARDEAQPGSDVDLFFDTDNPRFSLIELVDVQERIRAIIGGESDVMTRPSLHPMLRRQIEAEAIRVF